MKQNMSKPLPGMAEGQLWNTDNSYLQIVELGKSLAHFKVMPAPGQNPVLSRLIRIDALAVYLRACEATLISAA
jgi:hypothetical protein